MEVKKEFSIAHDGTEEQKRRHEILAIQDKERRDALELMLRYRDEQLKIETEKLVAERKRFADEEIAKKVKPDMAHRPPGVTGPSLEHQKDLIRKQIETKYGPIHAERVKAFSHDLNKEIDRAAKEARALDQRVLDERRAAAQRSQEAEGNSQSATENWKKVAFQEHQNTNRSQSKGRKP